MAWEVGIDLALCLCMLVYELRLVRGLETFSKGKTRLDAIVDVFHTHLVHGLALCLCMLVLAARLVHGLEAFSKGKPSLCVLALREDSDLRGHPVQGSLLLRGVALSLACVLAMRGDNVPAQRPASAARGKHGGAVLRQAQREWEMAGLQLERLVGTLATDD